MDLFWGRHGFGRHCCGRNGLAVIVLCVAVMDFLGAVIVCGRHCCGRHGLWPSWYRPQRQTRYACTDDNVDTVDSLLLSQEDKPQSHRTVREISREAGDPSIISFAYYSQRSAFQVLQEKVRSIVD